MRFSEADGGYIADSPDLKYCSAFGDTPAEALAELELARKPWLEVVKETGNKVPEPSYKPVIYQSAH